MISEKSIERFVMPRSIIYEFSYWNLLLRPKQVTLGSMAIIHREGKTKFAELDINERAEMTEMFGIAEKLLDVTFKPQKINFLCFMMVDPELNIHIIPRYELAQTWKGVEFPDTGYPKYAEMEKFLTIDEFDFDGLKKYMREKLEEIIAI